MKEQKISTSIGSGIGNTLMRASAIQQSLNQMSDFRSLLVRFGEILTDNFGVLNLGFARIGRQQARLHLKRRFLKIANTSAYDPAFWAAFEKAVTESGALADDRGDGLLYFSWNTIAYYMCIIEDPKSKSGRLIVWEIPDHSMGQYDSFSIALLEYAVSSLQAEARWHRKMTRTESLLYVDDLTGLYNHRYLEISLENELRRADRFQNNFCLMFIDLDGFKPVNDQHGHLSGSSVLKQVADVIKDAVREIDIPIRYGGDEFVVLLLAATSTQGLLAAERVRRNIERTQFKVEDGGTTRVTASIGVAAYPEHGKDKEALLRIADESMYKSKKSGKNRVTILSPGSGDIILK